MTERQETELSAIGNVDEEKRSQPSSKRRAGSSSSNRSRISDEASSAASYAGNNSEGSIRKQSILFRLKRALHLRNDLPPGFTYDYKIEQIVRSLDEYPVGYGKLAAIVGSDPSFLIYRKFSWLHNRVLLHYQDELAELEYELEALDQDDFQVDDKLLISRRRDDGRLKGSRRKELLKEIDGKLSEYQELLLRLQRLQQMKRPSERNQTSVFNMINNTGSLVTMERDWIQNGPDLIAVVQDQEHGWLNGFLEDTLNKISRKATMAVFRTQEQKKISGSEQVVLLSLTRLDILLRIIVTTIAAALLLVPVLILFKLQPNVARQSAHQSAHNSNLQILVIFLFTLVFSASCSIFTKARRQEVFTATAAYCAVLVVFLGNASNGYG
ncbi:hypothetical protein MMC22_008047 [Lobaria immixta]|nr:hypothetical protein [Lobaria immixta]